VTEPSRVAFVTGASYGVGAAIALALARDGFKLAVSATRRENLDDIVAALAKVGTPVLPVVLDLRSADSIELSCANVLQHFGAIDVLVNNAAVNLRRKAVDVTIEEWSNVIDTNITGTFFLTQKIGRHMIERVQPGCIINIASTHALVGAPERSTYGISKAALVQMTRMLAIEWAPHHIRVNAIAPGRMETASPSRQAKGTDPSYMREMLRRIPLGRLATVEEVAAAASYLAGPGARSVTGHTLVLDGGLTAA
jgi:NAD(P)-dependent dehydrogenase (short-subunit alcohol dehydrogenase family)